jgi:lipoate-protein ligase A
MLLIKNNIITDPRMNLALEEYCLRNLDPAHDYLLFYINESAIIIGKHQNPFQECNYTYAQEKGIQLVRRISGGGAVFHDHGNLNFSFITSFKKEKLDYFKNLIQPVLKTLHQLGVPAELTEKNNIVVKGKKVSGNAQYTNINRMLSHGTLLFDSELDVLQNALNPSLDFITSKGVRSVKSDVTNISEYTRRSINMKIFLEKLIEAVSDQFGELNNHKLSGKDWDRIYELAQIKYKSWDWVFSRSPDFVVRHDIKYGADNIECAVHVRRGVIEHIEFKNEVTRQAAIGDLQSKFIGERYDAIKFERMKN